MKVSAEVFARGIASSSVRSRRLLQQCSPLSVAGYKYMFDDKLVTVWSAPNYCYRCGNIAAVLAFTDVNTRTAKLYHAVPDTERVIPPRNTTPYFL
ncbi:hypothetical protein HPB48_002934 [Haemaphysalis longicornis]|uniref:Uncharacterized protein n=1 Tax=Haemaphysalis longicornis TaxID=44386 RepID=A0A9J6FFF2_HAELO|nr:hypothetical protein HPB48_002934 [Haemaphysalis longicornis]